MKIWTIVRKEWTETFKNRLVLWTMVFTPLLFVGLAVGTLATTSAMDPGDTKQGMEDLDEIKGFVGEACDALGGLECMEVYLATLYLLMFMMLPALLPAVFAAYSVVGEKTSRTLEPLLATPIETWELLVGKCIGAVVPGILATWLGVGLYLVACSFMLSAPAMAVLVDTAWMLAVLVVGPLLAVFSVLVSVMVSSRVEDPRTAQQISGLVVLPMVGLVMAQSMGMFMVNEALVGVAAVGLVVVDLVLAWVAVQVFEREAILTRWK